MVVERDLPYYDPAIPEHAVDGMNQFAQEDGILSEQASYDQVVATQFRHLWIE